MERRSRGSHSQLFPGAKSPTGLWPPAVPATPCLLPWPSWSISGMAEIQHQQRPAFLSRSFFCQALNKSLPFRNRLIHLHDAGLDTSGPTKTRYLFDKRDLWKIWGGTGNYKPLPPTETGLAGVLFMQEVCLGTFGSVPRNKSCLSGRGDSCFYKSTGMPVPSRSLSTKPLESPSGSCPIQ